MKLASDFWLGIRTLAIIFFSLIASVALSQENQTGSEIIQAPEKMPLNTFTIGIGRASEVFNGGSFSNIGFDYLRRLNPKWELGLQLDIDWEKNFVQFEGVQLAAIVAFSITNKWPVFSGFGIAGEENHSEGFFRMGTEYTFFIGKKQMFFIAPGTFVDITLNDVAISAMVALGVNW